VGACQVATEELLMFSKRIMMMKMTKIKTTIV